MSDNASDRVGILTWLALLFAVIAVAGSLYLSLGLGLVACPLCFYQRTFAVASLCVLAVGILGGVRPGWRISLLALAPALGGLGMAGWHYSRVAAGVMVCPNGILDLGPAPLQALVSLALLAVVLIADVAVGSRQAAGEGARALAGGVAALILGLGLAYASVTATEMVPLPKDYSKVSQICHPAPK
jgi:disulfide bond formation protein DsbB